MQPNIAQVALPIPLDKCFDYLFLIIYFPVIGGRVSVPFGRQTLTGIVMGIVKHFRLSD